MLVIEFESELASLFELCTADIENHDIAVPLDKADLRVRKLRRFRRWVVIEEYLLIVFGQPCFFFVFYELILNLNCFCSCVQQDIRKGRIIFKGTVFDQGSDFLVMLNSGLEIVAHICKFNCGLLFGDVGCENGFFDPRE